MIASQRHRGPDHEDVGTWGSVALGYVRLAIQSPDASGNQPVVSEDGRYALVFNGEIYNYKELRQSYSLPERGSDAHVLLGLWAMLGQQALTLLRGMYAFALLDTADETLVLARDPFGIKPLLFSQVDDTFTFASEVRALAETWSDTSLSQDGLENYLRFGSLRPEQSPFAAIRAVEPGTFVTVRRASPSGEVISQVTRFHSFTEAIEEGQPADAARSIIGSVEAHLVSDVPVSLLLSAGVDSTVLALAAARLGTRLHCITVDGPGMAEEAPIAAETARRYGHSHQLVPADRLDWSLDDFVAHLQRPTIDGLNTFIVCRAIREAGFRVALSGLGGDEALAGYSHARLIPYLGLLRASDVVPDRVKSLAVQMAGPARGRISPKAERLLLSSGPRRAGDLPVLQRELFSAPLIDRLLQRPPCPAPVPEFDAPVAATPVQEWAAAERAIYMASMLLPDADCFSMAQSVELRVPFVDLPFYRAALAMPRVVGRLRGKDRLVSALDDDHLTAVSRRTKTGFALPMRDWLLDGPLRSAVAQASDPAAPVWDHLDRETGLGLLSEERIRTRWSECWAVTVLDLWLRSLTAAR